MAQTAQSDAEDDPMLGLYVPATQSVQEDCAMEGLYVPAEQLEHVKAAEALEYVPEPHARQDVDAGTGA